MRPFAELDDWASDDQPQSAVINGSNEELVGVRNPDHPCDLRLRPSWPRAKDGTIAPSRGPARDTCPQIECG
jgi:hypothetical protein